MSRKYITILISIFLLVFICLTIYFLIPKSYIVFRTAPEQVAVLINNKDRRTINNGDSITLSPGKYTFIVFRDEFNPFNKTIEIKNGETVEVVAALTALTDKAQKLLDNAKSNLVIEKATGINMDAQAKMLEKNYPILKILPQNTPYYRITVCPSQRYPNNQSKTALCIDVVDAAYSDIVYQDMNAAGYDLNNYETIWTYNSN